MYYGPEIITNDLELFHYFTAHCYRAWDLTKHQRFPEEDVVSYPNAKNISNIVISIDALNAAINAINANSTKSPVIQDLTINVPGVGMIRIDPGIPLSSSDSLTIINAIFNALQTLLSTQNTNLASAPNT